MKLTSKPEIVQWPEMHYTFIEKVGPFQETAMACWQELHKYMNELDKTGAMALYKMQPQMIYRAGVSLKSKPEKLPAGMKYEKFPGGKYSKFTLTGPYDLLPEASGKVMQMVKDLQIPVASNFYIENYANDPSTTPPDQLITEILVPTT